MTSIINFKDGLFDTINPFFADESPKIINGVERLFPEAVMYFDIRELEAYTPSSGDPPVPVITMIPSISRIRKTKCQDESNTPGYLDHMRIPVTCYIKMLAFSPLTLPDGTPANHKLLADYTWDLFQLVVNTQVTGFNSVNIFKPECARYPSDVTDDKETILIGTAYFETEYFSYPE